MLDCAMNPSVLNTLRGAYEVCNQIHPMTRNATTEEIVRQAGRRLTQCCCGFGPGPLESPTCVLQGNDDYRLFLRVKRWAGTAFRIEGWVRNRALLLLPGLNRPPAAFSDYSTTRPTWPFQKSSHPSSTIHSRSSQRIIIPSTSFEMPYGRDRYDDQTWGNGIKHLKDLKGRMEHFVGGMYSEYNLSSVLYTHRLDDRKHVNLSVWSAPGRSKPTFEEASKQKYKPAQKGDDYGPPWTNHWFKISLAIPRDWDRYERVSFEFDCSGEGLIYTPEGITVHGLTGGHDEIRRVEYIIPDADRKKGTSEFFIEASCNEMFGQNRNDLGKSDPNRRYKLESADLVVINMDAQRLIWDFDALYSLNNVLPAESPLNKKAEWVANKIMNTFDAKDLSCLTRCRKIAQEVLGEGWEKQIAKESQHSSRGNGQVWALGHWRVLSFTEDSG